MTPCRTIRLPAKRKVLETHQADPVHCATRHRTHPPIPRHTPRPPILSFQVVPARCLPLHRVWIRIMVPATRGGSARRPRPDRRRERGSNNQSLPPQEVTGASDSPSGHCHKLPIHLLLRLCRSSISRIRTARVLLSHQNIITMDRPIRLRQVHHNLVGRTLRCWVEPDL